MNLNLSVFIHFISRKKNLLAYAPTIIVGARVTFDFIETAVSKCSGNPMYYIPLANGGGVAT